VASFVAVAGLWYSSVQTRQATEQARQDRALTKEGQITDRYTAAVSNLGEDKTDVRLGGIYALQRIMKDSPRDQGTIVNVLAAYVRTHAAKAPKNDSPAATGKDLRETPADVDAAFTVLVTRDTSRDISSERDRTVEGERNTRSTTIELDLRAVSLPGTSPTGLIEQPGADLFGANLSDTDLRDANLHDADLRDADLEFADLRGANLEFADLRDAALSADLRDAFLHGVDLRGAGLYDADLRGADLGDADRTWVQHRLGTTPRP
jgi:hypothetical protein